MGHSNAGKVKRIAAGIMGLLMLIIVLFSAFYIAAEADHDCAGEDCPICVCIRLCESTLRGMADRTATPLSAVAPVLFMLFLAAIFVAVLPLETPVSRKDRLNN